MGSMNTSGPMLDAFSAPADWEERSAPSPNHRPEPSRGLTYALDPDVASALRRPPRFRERPRSGSEPDGGEPAESPEYEEEEASSQVSPSHQEPTHDGDDDLSWTAPPTLPVVWIDLERLVGYIPQSAAEAQQLQQQVQTAFLGPSSSSRRWATSRAERENSSSLVNPQEAVSENERDHDNDDDDDPPPDHHGEEEEEQDYVAARQFDARVTELFDQHMAIHGDTETCRLRQLDEEEQQQQSPFRFMALEYPEYLCCPKTGHDDDDDDDSFRLVPTARLWKRLLTQTERSSSIPVVQKLLRHVLACSRSLLWKEALVREVGQGLVPREEQARRARQQAQALWSWRTDQRPEKLQQLYTLREMLDQQVHTEQERVRQLTVQRDERARMELRRRRQQQQQQLLPAGFGNLEAPHVLGGLEAFDFDSTVFAFPDEQKHDSCDNLARELLGLMKDGDDDDDEAYNDDEGMEESVADGVGDHDPSWPDESVADQEEIPDEGQEEAPDLSDEPVTAMPETSELLTPLSGEIEETDRRQKRKRAAQRRRYRLEAAASEAEHKAKLERARAEEELMKETCTTTELRMASAKLNALQQQLDRVDNLLESLQEEEWKEEEEGIVDLSSDMLQSAGNDHDYGGMSLLDQILAMVFSATPAPRNKSPEEHASWMKDEHQAIVEEWKKHFGRLPPALIPSDAATEASSKAAQSGSFDTTNIMEEREGNGEEQELKRATLGIIDNEDENWDSSDGEDLAQSLQRADRETETKTAPKVGFRPGTRLA